MACSCDYGHKSAITSWQFGIHGKLDDDIRLAMAEQAMILAALVKCLSDRPCCLPKFKTVEYIIVEDRKLR